VGGSFGTPGGIREALAAVQVIRDERANSVWPVVVGRR
jgi:hypothetical protein